MLFYLGGGFYTFFRLRSEASFTMPVDKVAALKTLRTTGDVPLQAIMANRFDYGDEIGGDEQFYAYSAFAEQRLLSEGKRFGLAKEADPYLTEIRRDIRAFYSTTNANEARRILQKWRVDYCARRFGIWSASALHCRFFAAVVSKQKYVDLSC